MLYILGGHVFETGLMGTGGKWELSQEMEIGSLASYEKEMLLRNVVKRTARWTRSVCLFIGASFRGGNI